MIKNNILINTETRNIKKRDYDFLGVAGENSIEQLVFKLTAFINGTAILEIEKYNTNNQLETYFIELDQKDESYILEVKSSLLDVAKDVKMQLHITTENMEVFKSKAFPMHVYEQIKATETVPEQYAEWIDTANAKIAQMNNLKQTLETAEQERIQAEINRKNAEITRNDAETARIQNETSRNESETERNTAETTRKKNESDRIVNENGRVEAESSRRSAETERQTTENERIANEEARQTAEENRETNTTNAINQIQNLNTAYEQLAEEKTAELTEIAEGIEDLTTSMQFPIFDVEGGRVAIIQTEKLKNTNFGVEEGRIYKEVHT